MKQNTSASVMRMVTDYERSIRESLLTEIRGWRKALALGAAGLAGLSPMKAQAVDFEPHATAQVSQDDLQYPAFKAGYEAGKASPRILGLVGDERLAGVAIMLAFEKGYAEQGQITRDFVQGWLDGYVTTHNLETGNKRQILAIN